MGKVILPSVLLLFSMSALSIEDVTLDFDQVPAIQFVKATYGEVLKKNYVMSPDALAVDKNLSMKVTSSEKGLMLVLSQALRFAGLSAKKIDDVYFIDIYKDEPLPEKDTGIREDEEVEIYRPRFRSVEYLRSLVSVVDRRSQVGSQVPSVQPYQQNFQQMPMQQMIAPPVQSPQVQQQNALNANSQNNAMRSGALQMQQMVQSGFGSQSLASVQDVLLIVGDEKRRDRIKALLLDVDKPATSILVKAVLMEISNSDDDSFDFSAALKLLGGKVGISIGAGVVAANNLSIKAGSLEMMISAVQGDNRYRIISEPRILVVDGGTGKLSVGSEVPTRAAVSSDNNGNLVQSVEYRSSGVILSVSPRVYRDRVSLKLNQQISNFALTQTSSIDSPTLVKRDIESSFDLADGDIAVIGGLDEEKNTSSHSGLSFLPRFMSGYSSSSSKSQIVMLVEAVKVQRPADGGPTGAASAGP